MLRGFEIATGTVAGRTHALAGRASQDAYALREERGHLVAVVADGCGSGEQSEVGAVFGANVVVTSVLRALDEGESLGDERTWGLVRARSVEAIRTAARAMGGDLEEVVRRCFLFTVVGLAIAGDRAAVFAAGDGLVAVNGEVIRLGPFPGNAPPYLGHALLSGNPGAQSDIVVVRSLPSAEVESVLLATDGADEWPDLEKKRIPGTSELVGPLRGLWEDDRSFENPDALRRKLWRMNRPVAKPIWEERRMERETGLLEDDTTVVVIRRTKR